MYRLFVLAVLTVCSFNVRAQAQAEIVGSWSGVSLCVDKATDTACKDELVLYRFRPDPSTMERVVLDAWKLVERDTVFMMTLTFTPSAIPRSWECVFTSPRYQGLWGFTVIGRALAGTLIDLPSKRLVRRVVAERITP
jgi:hypothetical protein